MHGIFRAGTIRRKSRTAGFTIVELLIVIVVIGILAAITIATYNGIQTRAENSKTIQAVSQYVKGLHSYAVLNDGYPVDVSFPCLGPFPDTKCGRVGTTVANCLGTGGAVASRSSFDTKMKQVFSGTMPTPSTQSMSCSGSTFGGAYYYAATAKSAGITYFLRGDQSCGGVGGVASLTRAQQEDLTRCVATLPTTVP